MFWNVKREVRATASPLHALIPTLFFCLFFFNSKKQCRKANTISDVKNTRLCFPPSPTLGFCPSQPLEELIALGDVYLPNILYKQVTEIIHTPTNYQVTQ